MTAAEILRNAQPPADDGLIEKALADLDAKIGEWTDSLRSAQTQLRGAFSSPRPVVAQRPSAALFDAVPRTLSEAAAAAHIPSPPPLPDWSALGAAVTPPAWNPPAGAPPAAEAWPQPAAPMAADPSTTGVMPWPTTTGPTSVSWPDSSSSTSPGPQAWPTWTPTDVSASAPAAKSDVHAAPGSGVRATKAPKAVRPPVPEGPTPEERAAKAAAEEAQLSQLDEAVARRVRLLRRLDPDTPIEKLIEKAVQGQAEAAAAAPAKDEKSSGSSWWRRK